MYYHVSDMPNGQCIVSGSDPRKGTPGFWSPQVPKKCPGESRVPRFCIAPTVGQCLASKSGPHWRKKYYIYEVNVMSPDTETPQRPESGVADARMTSEAWITESVIRENQGVIKLTKIGWVSLGGGEILALKKCAEWGDFEKYRGQESIFWDVCGDQWKLKRESERTHPSPPRTLPTVKDES
jgi:hypothetical protein